MTAINLTFSPGAGHLSTDTLWSELIEGTVPGAQSVATIEESVEQLTKGPAAPFKARAFENGPKFSIFTQARTVIACTGPIWAFANFVQEMAPLDPAEAEDIADAAPARLAALAAECPFPASFVVLMIGWSRRENRALAWMFASDMNYAAVPIDEDTSTPTLMPDPMQAWVLRHAQRAAARGKGVETYHLELMRCQTRASQDGRYFDGLAIGGQCWIATVGPDGVTYQMVGDLPVLAEAPPAGSGSTRGTGARVLGDSSGPAGNWPQPVTAA